MKSTKKDVVQIILIYYIGLKDYSIKTAFPTNVTLYYIHVLYSNGMS